MATMLRIATIISVISLFRIEVLKAQDTNIIDPLFQNFDEELFEGDIIPTYESITDFYGEELAIALGLEPLDENVRRGPDGRLTRHWKVFVNPSNGKYYVPYSFGIGSNGAYTSGEQLFISDTLQDLASATGVIDFILRTTEDEYITIQNDGGCSSFIGRVGRFFSGGSQSMNIGWCVNAPASIQHEMMHAMGFYHEQSRIDRDEYVSIHSENIIEAALGNFDKSSSVNSLESPYDFCSVMHYSPGAFAKIFGQVTISMQDGHDGCTESQFSSFSSPFGQRFGPSDVDVQQIRQVYQCSDGNSRTLTDFQADICTDICKCWEGASGCNDDNQCFGGLVCSNQVCEQRADTDSPTTIPTSVPSTTLSRFPSTNPSYTPSIFASIFPTILPSKSPSDAPSTFPSTFPTFLPSKSPSNAPSISPTELPSSVPSLSPTLSTSPSQMPSVLSSALPSTTPSVFPSLSPSSLPSITPSYFPSLEPSKSNKPSFQPTNEPSFPSSVIPSRAPSRVIFTPLEPVPCRQNVFTTLLKRMIYIPDEETFV